MNVDGHKVNIDSVPSALKARNQWVCWRYEDRDGNGKLTKPPIDPRTLKLAKTNDPATWAPFSIAINAYTLDPAAGLQGVGFCFAEGDRLTGIDLDHVIDPNTGELNQEAAEILERFKGTYWEKSPSGTGLHGYCCHLGTLELPKNKIRLAPSSVQDGSGKPPALEVYKEGRYFTVTGHHWAGSASEVTEQQAALDWLHQRFMATAEGQEATHKAATAQGERGNVQAPATHPPAPVEARTLTDAELLEKARAASNGGEFSRLFDQGDLSAHKGDRSSADQALCNHLAFWTQRNAEQMDRLFRQSALMRDKWDEPRYADGRTYGEGTTAKAIQDCRAVYGDRQRATAEDWASTGGDGLDAYRGTDEANAALFLRQHGNNVRYCPPWEKWLSWTGTHWTVDDKLAVRQWAADLPRTLYRDASTATDSAVRQSIAELARKLESGRRQAALLDLARLRVVAHNADLDRDPFLLNAANGTVDLRTGELRAHQRGDLLTHNTGIDYDPAAECPTFTQFLHDVFNGDTDLIEFIRRAVGYTLTGDVREQVLFIPHGCGSNGKSVFLNILRGLLGELALQAAPDLLMSDHNRRHPTEQAALYGRRAVICQETEQNRRFNETLVKQLTGGDRISARRMREDFWEFSPTGKIWLSTNHKPEIRGTDHAIWRRIRLIPFNVTFHDPGRGLPEKDTTMEERLRAEMSGILTWAVQGCLAWQRDGLTTPAAVQDATDAYRQQQDVLAAWIGESCIESRTATASVAALYASYIKWCEDNGERPEPKRRFGARLTERGFKREHGRAGYVWLGLGLLQPEAASADSTGKVVPFRQRATAEDWASTGGGIDPVSIGPPETAGADADWDE